MELSEEQWHDLLKACLNDVVPAEVSVAGDDDVDQVIELTYLSMEPDYDAAGAHGMRNDVIDSIKIMVEVATFVKTAVEIYILLRDKFGRSPSSEEILAEKTDNGARISSDDKSKIIEIISRMM